MMRILCVFMVMAFAIGCAHVCAQPLVTEGEAVVVAMGALRLHSKVTGLPQILSVTPMEKDEQVKFYEVLFSTGESVFVSGSKAVRPILAIDDNPKEDPMLGNLATVPEGMLVQMEHWYTQEYDVLTKGVDTGWAYLFGCAAGSVKVSDGNVIGPLLTARWRQVKADGACDACKPAYNEYMPLSTNNCTCSEGYHYPAGCTTVAFGQVMHYWKFPTFSKHLSPIDWCNMPDRLVCGDSDFAVKQHAVASFLGQLAVDLGVSFGKLPLGLQIFSGDRCFGYRNPSKALSKAKEVYGYSDSAEVLWRTAYKNSSWKNKIYNELKNGRPVIYYAVEDAPLKGGHTFVCDGYDSKLDLFHFNWGHGNKSSWCSIDSIVEGKDRHWTRNECAIVGFEPAGVRDLCSLEVDLGQYFSEIDELFQAGFSPNDFVPHISRVLKSASVSAPAQYRTIHAGDTVRYIAHEQVVLRPGFVAERGSAFIAGIAPCAACQPEQVSTLPTVVGTSVRYEAEGIRPGWSVKCNSPSDADISVPAVYPNPTKDKVSVDVREEVCEARLMGMNGVPIMNVPIGVRSAGIVEVGMEGTPAGVYFLRVVVAGGSIKVAKIVKQ